MATAGASMSDAVGILALVFDANGCEGYVPEYKFHPSRKWRFDFAWPDKLVAVEYEGGLFQRGWHQSIDRYMRDCRKYTAAALLGWTVLRFTAADSVADVVEQVREALGRV